jgi:CubicO group peptidase (beta-lactamase class C family)
MQNSLAKRRAIQSADWTMQASDPTAASGLFSHFDEVYPARTVARGGQVRQFTRAATEPAINYGTPEGPRRHVGGFLASTRTMGLLILQGERILAERDQYDRTAEQRFHSQSIAKTVVAILFGIALQEGKIHSIDDLAQDYFPALADSPYGKPPAHHVFGVKYHETCQAGDDNAILTARTYKQQSVGGADALAPFAARKREVPAGARFYYASSETVALTLALHAAVGVPLAEYLSEKVWQPMGAEADASWLADAAGYEVGFIGLNATPRDYGRLGLLLADEGAVVGQQIVPNCMGDIDNKRAFVENADAARQYDHRLVGPQRCRVIVAFVEQRVERLEHERLVLLHSTKRLNDADAWRCSSKRQLSVNQDGDPVTLLWKLCFGSLGGLG